MTQNRQVLLASRPQGAVSEQNFRIVDVPLRAPADGEVLVRNEWLSLDPYMRGRMNEGPSYTGTPNPSLGEVMVGGTVSEVVHSNNDRFAAGDLVAGSDGWRSHSVSSGAGLRKLDPKAAPISTALGVLGMPGLTAYVGLLDIGRPKAGETVVVSAAAGAVGSAVGQIAKLIGCRPVGITGGPTKVRLCLEEFGYEAAVDYQLPSFARDLEKACTNGVNVYFDNTSGRISDTVLTLLARRARVVICGTASVASCRRRVEPARSSRRDRPSRIRRAPHPHGTRSG